MNDLYIEIGMDGTQSMKTVFPSVYKYLENCINKLKAYQKNEDNRTKVFYGVSVFHGGSAERVDHNYEVIEFGTGITFTQDGEAVLKKLRELELSGGSRDGYEPQIVPAIKKSLEKLKDAGNSEKDSRGLWFITDSLPSPDQTRVNYDEIQVARLRFAHLFFYDIDRFMVKIPVTNTQNHEMYGKGGLVTRYSISELLDDQMSQEKSKELMGIVYKTSMNLN